MTLERRRLHRFVFNAAGVYNLVFGLGTAAYPLWFFRVTGMEPPIYPEIFGGLGMVLALFGVLYLRVAADLENGWFIAAVGLASKILSPLSFLLLVLQGKWPLSAAILLVPSDLVWWVPFALYLRDCRRYRVAGAASATAGDRPPS